MTMKGNEHTERGPARAALASGPEEAVPSEATIDQVRELLFGGAQRSIQSSLSGLREEMETSLKKLQAEFSKELAALHAKVSELERDTEQKRLAAQRDIGAAISELGTSITRMGSSRTG
ncbi:MAG: hypothetical protein JSR91_17275 [Proteobacteria bacterium]|nr:hypothetical protein [Pseudomonadota bacterium]